MAKQKPSSRWPMRALLLGVLSLPMSVFSQEAANPDLRTVDVEFVPKTNQARYAGQIKGRQYVDYRVQAGAGQNLEVRLQTRRHTLASFNVLPPESTGEALFIEGGGPQVFHGRLPDDGLYVIRVYLQRAQARRNQGSDFVLTVKLSGDALLPLPVSADALIPGTRYHARGQIACQPPWTPTRLCEASVVRRDFAGTATVDVRWDQQGRRRILFIKGRPEAVDVPLALHFSKDERDTVTVDLGGQESYAIPDALIYGG